MPGQGITNTSDTATNTAGLSERRKSLTIIGLTSWQSIQRSSPLPRNEAGFTFGAPQTLPYRLLALIDFRSFRAIFEFGCAKNTVLSKLLRAIL